MKRVAKADTCHMLHAACIFKDWPLNRIRKKEPPAIESVALFRFGVAIDSYLFCFHCFLLFYLSCFSRYLIIRRCMLQVKTNIWVNGPNNNSNSNPHQPSASTTTSDNLINNLYCIILLLFDLLRCKAATCFHFFHLARTATTQRVCFSRDTHHVHAHALWRFAVSPTCHRWRHYRAHAALRFPRLLPW